MTVQFFLYAAVQLILFFWVVSIYRKTGAAAALVLLVPQFFLFYDNFVVAIGSFIGLGPLLKAISWPRFWAHWFTGYWIIIAAGSILRLADFSWAKNKFVMASFCVLTVGLMVYETSNLWRVDLFPICQADLVRYTTTIRPGESCVDPAFQIKQQDSPLAVIIANFIIIIVGAILAIRRRFPWMMLGGILMLLSAALPAARALKLDNFGEILITGGIIWAVAHFAGKHRRGTSVRTVIASPVL